MTFLQCKTDNCNAYLFILAGMVIALCLRIDAQYLSAIALLTFFLVCYSGFFTPWGFLLTAVTTLFGIESAPSYIGFGEGLIILLLFFYVAGTYAQEFLNNSEVFNRGFLIGHVVLALVIIASCFQSVSYGIFFKDWLRAITPFLILYLIIPISITVRSQFEDKLKWLFASFSLLSILLSAYINIIFFKENYYAFYWIKTLDGEKIFNLTGHLDVSELMGPFKARITMRIHQSTSELLPVGLVCFSAIAIFGRNKVLKIITIPAMLVTLFAILETYTRSMLLSPAIVLMLLGIVALIMGNKLYKEYIKVMLILFISTLVFVQSFNMGDIWLGRLNSLFRTFAGSVTHDDARTTSGSVTHDDARRRVKNQRAQVDENILVRMREYNFALNTFKKHVVIGAGLGVQHKMSFQTSEGNYLHQKVSYVHSWIMYWLMVGGIIGLIFYMSCLLGPLILFYKLDPKFNLFKIISASTLLTLSIYANFFAVFRLISFNLILAVSCGIAFYFLKLNNSLKEGVPC